MTANSVPLQRNGVPRHASTTSLCSSTSERIFVCVNIPDDFYTHLKDQSFMSWRKCSAGGLVVNIFGEVQGIAEVSGHSRILRVIKNLIFL